jgi:hypothetical protein
MMTFPHKLLLDVTRQTETEKNTSPLQFNLQEADGGLKVSLNFSVPKAEEQNALDAQQVGGDFLVFLDEVIIISETYTGSSLSISRAVPLTNLQSGRHILSCELRSPGGELFKDEIQFLFDGTPVMKVTKAVPDKNGMLDPSIEMNFLRTDDEIFGFLEIFLDEIPVKNAQIEKEHIGKKVSLSQIIGESVSTANLVPGTHLLTLVIRGINGDEAVSYCSIVANTSPELKILHNSENSFQEAVASFLKSHDGYSGSVEVFWNHNIILSKRDNEALITIERAEIIDGMKKIHQDFSGTSVPLVFSLHAANGSQYWQQIDFK